MSANSAEPRDMGDRDDAAAMARRRSMATYAASCSDCIAFDPRSGDWLRLYHGAVRVDSTRRDTGARRRRLVTPSRFDRRRRWEGVALLEAVISGCRSKFRPVLMTTATTALGLLPLIIARGTGSEIQRPLAIVVVFGLATSTAVTLFVIPAAYIWMESKWKRNKQKETEE